AEEAGSAQSAFGRGTEQHAVQPADLASFEHFDLFELLHLADESNIGRGDKGPSAILGPHRGRHGGEGKDPLDAEIASERDQVSAERAPTDRRLCLPEKQHQIVLTFRGLPGEEAVSWLAAGMDD